MKEAGRSKQGRSSQGYMIFFKEKRAYLSTNPMTNNFSGEGVGRGRTVIAQFI